MVISITLPFILVLGMLGGDLIHSYFWGRFNWFRPSEDDVPILTCQSSGYLQCDPWTFLGVNLSLDRMSFSQAKKGWNWVVG